MIANTKKNLTKPSLVLLKVLTRDYCASASDNIAGIALPGPGNPNVFITQITV